MHIEFIVFSAALETELYLIHTVIIHRFVNNKMDVSSSAC